MAAHSFFVEPGSIQGEMVELRGQVAHQVGKVLRLHPGDVVELLDNSGYVYQARIVAISRSGVGAEVLGRRRRETEPRVELELYQVLLKGQKLEWVLQKGTEVGVSRFVPMLSERCVSKLSGDDIKRKLDRWAEIVREAAEQSRRAVLPQVAPLVSFGDACREAVQADLAIMAWEEETSRGIGELLRDVRLGRAAEVPRSARPRIALLVGPEGGFSEKEAETAREAGVRVASLGLRILRAETAAMVAATVVLYEMGDLGGR